VTVPGIGFREQLEDVETLNQLALDGALDITKVSYHALGYLRDRYALLRSGGALGRDCGPLVVAQPGTTLTDLREKTVAIPGKLTTASAPPALRSRTYEDRDRPYGRTHAMWRTARSRQA
jgi:1,4-dihydroxy-6-naphthoate synthase